MDNSKQVPTILYVDDEPDNLLALRAALRRKNKVLTAESGAQALDILEQEKVHILISDQRMPGMTGTALLEKSQHRYPDQIRILLTGYSDLQAVIDAVNKGRIHQYISKPWRAEELQLIIEQAWATFQLRKANQQLTSERDLLRLRTAQQEREQVKAKFEILRHQVNPHFLFNSLNVLASLIAVDSRQALAFTQRFAKVYRRLLEVEATPLVSLAEELAFVEDYLFLQKTRFDEALQVEQHINPSHLTKQLPPFALQLLLENAMKHNVVSENQPLHILIRAEDDYLTVINNLQTRQNPVDSTRIGLHNLQERYRLLGSRLPVFEKTTTHYRAKLPLI
jgi:CheY-like chemotaxis protein